jgi:hypothetical protein
MSLIIAAIKSGTDPIGPLPPAAFHRWLEDPIYCPKCEATYVLVVDYDQAISRHFAEESRRHVTMLRKSITLGHSTDHRVSHFETNGVVVTPHTAPKPPSVETVVPLTKLIN